jgi:hypothetical protein
MSDAFDKLKPVDPFDALPEGGAEGGNEGPSKPLDRGTLQPGTIKDFAKSLANTAALHAGPQIEGVIGAVAHSATDPMQLNGTDLDAYRAVRDMGAEEHARSANTMAGKAAEIPGMLATPIPVKGLGPGASVGAKAARGAMVGGVAGLIQGAATSKGDLTKMSTPQIKQVLLDSLFSGVGGAVAGGALGGAMGVAEPPLRSTARKLPMDMLGVGEPARRSMQRQGIYDQAGDTLLSLVRPFRSGMRKGSLTEDALAELKARGENLDDVISSLDTKSGGKTVNPGSMAVSVLRGAESFSKGGLQSKQVADRMGAEAEGLLESLGDQPIPLARAEKFKSTEFGPGVAKLLRHAGEPAAKTTALGETYRALKTANEAGAANVDPALAQKFIAAKQRYGELAAPLEGANVERSGMRSSDFDLGDLAGNAPMPDSLLAKVGNSIPGVGPLLVAGGNAVGRAYGRGMAANAAEFAANRMANNTGGGVGGQSAASLLQPYLDLLHDEESGE